MGNVRLYGATSGYTELAPPAVAPDGVLSLPSGTGTLLTAEGGKVLSVNSVTSAATFSTSSTSFVDVTSMSITLTPKSATSTFILAFSTFQNRSGAAIEATYQYLRDATAVGNFAQDSQSGPPEVVSNLFPDSPATASPITYKVQAKTNANTLNIYTRSFIIWEVSA
jgi:hypothetical protein